MTKKPVVIIPNLNGGNELLEAVRSLESQTLIPHIIVVDNASTDSSIEMLTQAHPLVEIIRNDRNYGYAGGVNPGFKRAIDNDAKYAAPFNDDAVADAEWLEKLVHFLDANNEYGAACCKVLKEDKTIDSTGEFLTNWGLPFPRGRDEADSGQYDENTDIPAPSGAASLFRVQALRQVGLFDEGFFAYYEDIDLGLRLQLAGWKVGFVPEAKVYHKVGMTSGRVKGFTTLQTMKNGPLLIWKNLSVRQLLHIWPRFCIAHFFFFWRAVSRGQGWPALKGALLSLALSIKKIPERARIRSSKKVSDEYIWSMVIHDLPPNAQALRSLRKRWWKLIGKNA